ncbi:MAG: DUF4384 domain-containing protein [Deltaproteobacteria bacterium]|nr:DUF4384 domain-containing protein [Deltaproteobacteria bacterium]
MDRTVPCLSSYALEKAAGGKGWPTPLSQEQLIHIETCPLCAEKVRHAQAAEAEFRNIVMPDGIGLLAARLRRRRTERLLAWSVSGAAAVAAVLAVVLVLPHGEDSKDPLGKMGGRETDTSALQPHGAAGDSEEPSGTAGKETAESGSAGRQGMPLAERDYTGLKAASSLELYVKRGRDVFRHRPGTPLRPGDVLRVVPVAPERSCILLLLRDAAGDVQVVYPWNGKASGPMPEAGQPVTGAFELDERIGTEEWFAVFSNTPVQAAALVERVRGIGVGEAGRQAVSGVPVEVVVARYEKVVP